MITLLSLLLLLAPVHAEKGRIGISKDGKRIGTNDFSVAKHGAGYAMEGRVNIGDLNVESKMELDDKLRPTFYEVANREGTIRVKVINPISEIQTTVQGEPPATADFRFPEAGVILDNNFFHHYLMLLYRVQSGETSLPVFVPQDMSLGSAIVRKTGDRSYALEVGDVRLEATTDGEGKLIRLEVPAAKVVVER